MISECPTFRQRPTFIGKFWLSFSVGSALQVTFYFDKPLSLVNLDWVAQNTSITNPWQTANHMCSFIVVKSGLFSLVL